MKLPKRLQKKERTYLPKREHRRILVDRVNAADLRIMSPRFFCEDCSHFSSPDARCTLGYRAQHRREEQMALYSLTGTMALCRAIEID